MTEDGKAPDLRQIFLKWISEHFGRKVVILFLILSSLYSLYMKWDAVSKLPGIASAVSLLTRWRVPKADPNRFSILVAHLENDPNCDQERLIVEALKEFEGIQVLVLDRTIPLIGPVPEEKEKQGHEIARQYLKDSGASVLIWGTMLGHSDKSLPKLYWTASDIGAVKVQRYDALTFESQYRLPEVFWSDMEAILRLLVASRDAEFRAAEGHYVADRFPPFIASVRTLLIKSANRPGWDSDAKGSTLMVLAYALTVLGEQSGKREPLDEAVAAYKSALEEYTRERVPLYWAAIQHSLGTPLTDLSEHESGTQHLDEAIAAYKSALEERTRERVPMDWAMTQNNLGTALRRLGVGESGTQHVDEAVAAYKSALEEYTHERVPLYWAAIQGNLGNALTSLGERESSTQHLEDAVTAHKSALEEYTRERVPLYWAATQNNLAYALRTLGERESGTHRLEEAVAACNAALEERTSERVPMDWAATQDNLGNALKSLVS